MRRLFIALFVALLVAFGFGAFAREPNIRLPLIVGVQPQQATAVPTEAAASTGTAAPTATATPTASETPGTPESAFPLAISADGRYLVDQNNQPFLITGDSAWSLIAQLSQS